MRARAVVLAAALVMAPLGAEAADLVVWWEKGYYAQEDEAVRETIAAFEQESGKQVELVFYEQAELRTRSQRRCRLASRPTSPSACAFPTTSSEWAFDDRLVDLTDAVGHFSDLFDPDALAWYVVLNAHDRAEGAVRAADRSHDQPRPRLEEPPGSGGIHARGYS